VGPTLQGIYGAERTVTGQGGTRTLIVDQDYLRRAILEPSVEIVVGQDDTMPSYAQDMSDKDLNLILRYLTGGASRDLERGRQLMEAEGCLSCHSTDGSEIAGPTLKNIVGRVVRLKDGTEVVADDTYLREAILDPEKRMVGGYDPIMPGYEHLGEDEVQAMLDYMHSLSDGHDH